MNIELIDPVNDFRWKDFILKESDADVFHHPAWLNTIMKEYNFPIKIVAVVDEAEIKAGIPFAFMKSLTGAKKLISLPFSDYCNPLASNKEDVKYIFNYLEEKRKAENYSLIKLSALADIDNHYISEVKEMVHIIDILEDEDKMLKSFKRSMRLGIQKADRNELQTVIRNDEEGIDEFYKLHLMTRRKIGVPTQPKSFFFNILNSIFKNNLGFVATVYKKGRPIGSGLFLHFKNKLVYKYNASDPDYLQYRPNNLLVWEAVKFCIDNNLKELDFGKTDIENEGLRRFKRGWGAKEISLNNYYYPVVPENNLVNFLYQKVVSPVIRKTPEFIGKQIGETAYKYFPTF